MRLHKLLLNRRMGFEEASKIVERWPLDPTKKGVDLGERLRDLLRLGFPAGNASPPVIAANPETSRRSDLSSEKQSQNSPSDSDSPDLSSPPIDIVRQLSAAERLMADTYRKGHPRLFEQSSATQLPKQYLDVYTATGFLEGLRKATWLEIIKGFFSGK